MKFIFLALIGANFLAFAYGKPELNCGFEQRKVKIIEYEEDVEKQCNYTVVEDCGPAELNKCTEIVHEIKCPCKETLVCSDKTTYNCVKDIRKRWVIEDQTVCVKKTERKCIEQWVIQPDNSKVWECPPNAEYKVVEYDDCKEAGKPISYNENYEKCEPAVVKHCEIVKVEQDECPEIHSYNCKREPVADNCATRLVENCIEVHTRSPVTKYQRINVKVCKNPVDGTETADDPDILNAK